MGKRLNKLNWKEKLAKTLKFSYSVDFSLRKWRCRIDRDRSVRRFDSGNRNRIFYEVHSNFLSNLEDRDFKSSRKFFFIIKGHSAIELVTHYRTPLPEIHGILIIISGWSSPSLQISGFSIIITAIIHGNLFVFSHQKKNGKMFGFLFSVLFLLSFFCVFFVWLYRNEIWINNDLENWIHKSLCKFSEEI